MGVGVDIGVGDELATVEARNVKSSADEGNFSFPEKSKIDVGGVLRASIAGWFVSAVTTSFPSVADNGTDTTSGESSSEERSAWDSTLLSFGGAEATDESADDPLDVVVLLPAVFMTRAGVEPLDESVYRSKRHPKRGFEEYLFESSLKYGASSESFVKSINCGELPVSVSYNLGTNLFNVLGFDRPFPPSFFTNCLKFGAVDEKSSDE